MTNDLFLDEVCCARLPLAALPVLAGLRGVPGVRVALTADRACVRWPAGLEPVLRTVLPVPGVELFLQRGGEWFRLGHRLPLAAAPIQGEGQPLERVLFPAAVQAEVPEVDSLQRLPLELVRSEKAQPIRALLCKLEELNMWADMVSSDRIASLSGAFLGDQVLLLGKKLPALPASERFWGERILLPAGWCLEPALPESAWCQAFGIAADELLLLQSECAEVLPRGVLQPLTRAGIRLARIS